MSPTPSPSGAVGGATSNGPTPPSPTRVPPDARWLTAAEVQDGVRLATGREHTLVVPMPVLEVEGPAEHTLWITHPADDGAAGASGVAYAPRMPDFAFRVRVSGVQGDPTATTEFTWTARLDYTTLAKAPWSTAVEWTATVRGGTAPADLFRRGPGRILEGGSTRYATTTAVAGGTLTVTVAATIDGQAVRRTIPASDAYAVLVGGAHPPASAFQEFLAKRLDPVDADWLTRILCVEAHSLQFRLGPGVAAGPYRRAGHPVMNAQGDGGVGVGQVTNRPGQAAVAGPAELWDWRANLEGAIAIYHEKGKGVAGFLRLVRKRVGSSVDGSHAALVRGVNVARRTAGQPLVSRVVVPDLTADQVRDDQARGYNGYIGPTGQFGLGWHEFRLATEGGAADASPERLQLANEREEGGARVADATWVRIPPDQRPRKKPTPQHPRGREIGMADYVGAVKRAACS